MLEKQGLIKVLEVIHEIEDEDWSNEVTGHNIKKSVT
jgi:hypothetical protein